MKTKHWIVMGFLAAVVVSAMATPGGPVIVTEDGEVLRAKKGPLLVKPAPKPVKIDTKKSGTYKSGKWEYRYWVWAGPPARGRRGRLFYNGKEIKGYEGNIELNDYYETPWGKIYWAGLFYKPGGSQGWLPWSLGIKLARLLPSPEKSVPQYLRALELDKSSNGKTVSAVVGQEIIIRLKGNATTGYSWVVGKIEGDALRQVGKVKYVSDQPPAPAGGRGRGLMIHRVGGGGKYVFTFIAKKAGKAKLTLKYKRAWEKDKPAARTFTLTVNVKADPTADRVKTLKDNLDKFTLDVIYFGAGLSKAQECVYDLTLTATDFVRGYPSLRLKARISKDQALMIIDHLAKDGFLSDAREIDGKISLAAPREQTYRFFAGPTSAGGKFFFADIGWDMKTIKRLEALRKVLDGDAAKEMDKLLKRLEPHRKEWEKGAVKPTKPKSAKIDLKKSSTYKSGKWEYRYKVKRPGTRHEGYWGRLFYDGKEIMGLGAHNIGLNDYYETPWGKIYWVHLPEMWQGPHGWMPQPSPYSKRKGQLLPAPGRVMNPKGN